MSDPSPAAARPRSWWRRRLLDPLRQQLTQGVTPERVALTLAVGSALSLFPILGTTTLLCALVGVALRLNQPIIQSVNLVCAVIYLPALVALVRLGDRLAGGVRSSLDIPVMVALFRQHPAEFYHRFGTTAWHGILGWLVLVPIWLAVIYLGALPGLRRLLRGLRRGRAPGSVS